MLPMNNIYTQFIIIKKLSNNGETGVNSQIFQVPFPLTKEIERLKFLLNKLEQLTPKIPEDSAKMILQKLKS